MENRHSPIETSTSGPKSATSDYECINIDPDELCSREVDHTSTSSNTTHAFWAVQVEGSETEGHSQSGDRSTSGSYDHEYATIDEIQRTISYHTNTLHDAQYKNLQIHSRPSGSLATNPFTNSAQSRSVSHSNSMGSQMSQ